MKIAVVIGTRPEGIKLFPVIRELRKYPKKFDLTIVLTGQHRKMLDQVLKTFKLKPDADLKVMFKDQNIFEVSSRILKGLKNSFEKMNPDLVLVQGDTTSTFIAALAAFYHRIPVAHVEAGLRTGDNLSPFPEEMNRTLVSKIASLHFAPTRRARKNLMEEGIPKEKIYVVGNTVVDALHYILRSKTVRLDLKVKKILSQKRRRILVTIHRRESFGPPLLRICQALRDLAKTFEDIQWILPVHPNPNVKTIIEQHLRSLKNIRLLPPLDYFSFIRLMEKSTLILTDSGGIQEEAPSLHKTVLLLRDKSERPEAVAFGNTSIIGTQTSNIIRRVERLLNHNSLPRVSRKPNPFGDGHAGRRIVRILAEFNSLKFNFEV
jgi:UDP-N-acetylglucosamine 2-epimerase (non-hydrolysing)